MENPECTNILHHFYKYLKPYSEYQHMLLIFNDINYIHFDGNSSFAESLIDDITLFLINYKRHEKIRIS